MYLVNFLCTRSTTIKGRPTYITADFKWKQGVSMSYRHIIPFFFTCLIVLWRDKCCKISLRYNCSKSESTIQYKSETGELRYIFRVIWLHPIILLVQDLVHTISEVGVAQSIVFFAVFYRPYLGFFHHFLLPLHYLSFELGFLVFLVVFTQREGRKQNSYNG